MSEFEIPEAAYTAARNACSIGPIGPPIDAAAPIIQAAVLEQLVKEWDQSYPPTRRSLSDRAARLRAGATTK